MLKVGICWAWGFLKRNKVLQTSTYFVNPVSVWGEGYQLIEHGEKMFQAIRIQLVDVGCPTILG